MTYKIKKTISFLAFSIAIIFGSCQKDEIGALNQESAVIKAKEWFDNNKPSLEALKYTETVDWNNAIVLNNDGEQAIEVPLKLVDNASTNVSDDLKYKTFIRLLLIKESASSYKAFDIVYTTKDESFNNSNKSFNILNISSQYSGFITIQKNDNTISYSGKYENGQLLGLHNLDQGQNLTNRLACTYYVTVGLYTTCSNWVWYPDYGPGDLPTGYMPGISGPLFPNGFPYTDPCMAARMATNISQNSGFINAKNAIIQAGVDGNEHSITLGTAISGIFSQAPMNNGGPNGVRVNENLAGAWGAIHNHPNNTPLSSGDIYAAVTLNTRHSNFDTSIIITGGETYAIVITNLPKAQNFVKDNPPVISELYPPEFPDSIFDQILEVRTKLGESLESRTAAIAQVLDENNSGITLMKQDNSGKFNPIKFQKTIHPDGSVTYTAVPC